MDNVDWTSADSLYVLTLGAVSSGGHQFDPWWNGGSEFRLTSIFVNPITGNIDTAVHRFEFTRSQISNKSTITLSNLSLNPDW